MTTALKPIQIPAKLSYLALFAGTMRPLSDSTRNSIIWHLQNGHSSHQIARLLGVGHGSVDRVRLLQLPDVHKSNGGRPQKLTAADKWVLVRTITSGKVDTAVQAAQELKICRNITVSASTVRRALKYAGLKAGPKIKKPKLQP